MERLRLHKQENENTPHKGVFESFKPVKGKAHTLTKELLKREELQKSKYSSKKRRANKGNKALRPLTLKLLLKRPMKQMKHSQRLLGKKPLKILPNG